MYMSVNTMYKFFLRIIYVFYKFDQIELNKFTLTWAQKIIQYAEWPNASDLLPFVPALK